MAALVGMVGYAQAGKDTFAKFLGFKRIAFADPLKEAALKINPKVRVGFPDPEYPSVDWHTYPLQYVVHKWGWEWAKSEVPEVRPFLQNLGVAIRELDTDFWVKAAFKDYSPEVHTVFTDVRFPNEIDAIVEQGGIIVRIDRVGHGPANDHISEHAWQAFEPHRHYMFEDGAFDVMEVVAHDLRHRLA